METAATVALAASKLMGAIDTPIFTGDDPHQIPCTFTDDQITTYWAGFIWMSFYPGTPDELKSTLSTCYVPNDKFKADLCTAMNFYAHGSRDDDGTEHDDQLLKGVEAYLAIIPELADVFPTCQDKFEHVQKDWHDLWYKKWEWELKAAQKFQFLVQGGEARREAG